MKHSYEVGELSEFSELSQRLKDVHAYLNDPPSKEEEKIEAYINSLERHVLIKTIEDFYGGSLEDKDNETINSMIREYKLDKSFEAEYKAEQKRNS